MDALAKSRLCSELEQRVRNWPDGHRFTALLGDVQERLAKALPAPPKRKPGYVAVITPAGPVWKRETPPSATVRKVEKRKHVAVLTDKGMRWQKVKP